MSDYITVQVDKTLTKADLDSNRARWVCRNGMYRVERTPPGTQLRIPVEQAKRLG